MSSRLPVKKTYKLYIGGAFPRSESGRTYEAEGQNVARASRKDARDAVRAARAAFPGWAGMTAYNRGPGCAHRIAEVLAGRTGNIHALCLVGAARLGARERPADVQLVRLLDRETAHSSNLRYGARPCRPPSRPNPDSL